MSVTWMDLGFPYLKRLELDAEVGGKETKVVIYQQVRSKQNAKRQDTAGEGVYLNLAVAYLGVVTQGDRNGNIGKRVAVVSCGVLYGELFGTRSEAAVDSSRIAHKPWQVMAK